MLAEPLVWRFYPAEEEPLQAQLVWLDLTLPIAKGQAIAEIRVLSPRGRLVTSAPLLAAHEVKTSVIVALTNWMKAHKWLVGGSGFLFACLFVGILFKQR